MSRFSWWMLHEAKWYIFSFLTDFFLLSCIDCKLWYYFCMFKFVTQNYVIFNVFFLNIFFCFLSSYRFTLHATYTSVTKCRSGWHLHDLHLSFANFLFYILKICFDKEMLNAKTFFFSKCHHLRRKGSKKTKQIHVYTQSMLLYVYLYSKFYFSTSEWENSDIFFLNVRRKNKYYLFAHFTEFWSEIVFNN